METGLLNTKSKWSLSSQALKIIAIIAMIICHLAPLLTKNFFEPLSLVLYFIGRITGPLMFFFIVEGYHHTKNINRYTLRLAVFAAVSYLPYLLFVNTGLPKQPLGWLNFNIIFNLLLGLLALRVIHEVKKPYLKVLIIAALLLISGYADWQYRAISFIIMFDLLYGDLTKQRIGYCILALGESILTYLSPVLSGRLEQEFMPQYLSFAFIGLGLLLPALLLGRYNGQRGRTSKWLFYIFYPAHLVVIFIIAKCLGMTLVF